MACGPSVVNCPDKAKASIKKLATTKVNLITKETTTSINGIKYVVKPKIR